MLLPGKYKTQNGSEMEVSGKHGGISRADFDWLEEGGCLDCVPEPYDVDGMLVWICDYCGGGEAQWVPASTKAP